MFSIIPNEKNVMPSKQMGELMLLSVRVLVIPQLLQLK